MDLGSQISAHRTAAGLTQDELAKKVFVARQTVNNWENNKTLPDIDSLKRMAEVFGVSVDELLDPSRKELIAEAIEQRHQFIKLLMRYGFLWFIWATLLISQLYVEANYWGDPSMRAAVTLIYETLQIVCLVFYTAAWVRLKKFEREHDLKNVLDMAMFVEGRAPGSELPDDFVYRVLIPNLPAFWVAGWFLIVILILLTYPWP